MEKIVKRASLSIISRSRHFTCSLTTSTTVQVEDNDCLVWTSRRTREWYFSWSPLPPFDSARKIYSRLIVLLELVFPSDEDLSVIEERMCRTCNPCWASLFLQHLHHTGLCLRAGCGALLSFQHIVFYYCGLCNSLHSFEEHYALDCVSYPRSVISLPPPPPPPLVMTDYDQD
eukprot:scaffold14378_cov187-Ochromonas_danica.AAC.6